MTPEQTRDQGPPFFAWLIVGSPSLWGCRLSRQQFLTRIRTHPLRSVEHHGEKQQQCPGISPSTQIFASTKKKGGHGQGGAESTPNKHPRKFASLASGGWNPLEHFQKIDSKNDALENLEKMRSFEVEGGFFS